MAQEKKLDEAVMDFIEDCDGWCIKYWAGAKYTKNGIPDILACISGRFFGIEDKGPNGKPSMLQLKNLEWIRGAGGYGVLLYPKDFERFKSFVESNFVETSWYNENIKLQNEWKDKLEKI